MLHDIVETLQGTPPWLEFDKAIEALSTYVNPVKSREANQRRALTIKDLLIKVSGMPLHIKASADRRVYSQSNACHDMSFSSAISAN